MASTQRPTPTQRAALEHLATGQRLRWLPGGRWRYEGPGYIGGVTAEALKRHHWIEWVPGAGYGDAIVYRMTDAGQAAIAAASETREPAP